MRFVHASRFEVGVESLFGFHERPDALERLMPPWERGKVVLPPASLDVGTRVVVEASLGPLRFALEAEHVFYDRGVEFADRLRGGPFRRWLHRHRFFADGSGAVLVDDIEWSVGFAGVDRVAAALVVGPRLRRMFRYRHEETARALGAAPPTPVDADAFTRSRDERR